MKKVIALILTAAALLALAVPVRAAEAGKFLHQYYSVAEKALVCLGAELPAGGTISVTIGTGEEVASELTTAEQAGLSTTVYCLVDVSASMGTKALEQQKKLLHSISGRLGNNDSMVIAQVGEQFLESDLLTTTAQRKQEIDAIQQSGKGTNLYKAVADSVASLTTRNDFSINRCLVILSDGISDGADSTSEQTALNAIAQSTLPVYSVAILPAGAGEWARSRAQSIQNFADVSLGGMSFMSSSREISAEDTAAAIWKSMQNASVLLVDPNGIQRDPAQDTVLLLARYDVQDVRYEDTLEVYAADLSAAAVPPSSGETVESVPMETNEQEAPEPEKAFPWWIVIAAVAVVVIVVAVAVVLKKKKKGAANEVEAPEEAENELVFVDSIPQTMSTEPEKEQEKAELSRKPALQDGCDVTLTVIGHGELRYQFFLPMGQRKSAGRDGSRSDFALNQSDMKLSGRHLILEWNGRTLSVCDVSTYNSTCINGVRVQPKIWMNVQNGSTLRLGSCDYRVKFERGVH